MKRKISEIDPLKNHSNRLKFLKTNEIDELPDNFPVPLTKLICHYTIDNPSEAIYTFILLDEIDSVKWLYFMYNERIDLSKWDATARCIQLSYESLEIMKWITETFSNSFKPNYLRVIEGWLPLINEIPCMEYIIDKAIDQSGIGILWSATSKMIKYDNHELLKKYLHNRRDSLKPICDGLLTYQEQIHSSKMLKLFIEVHPNNPDTVDCAYNMLLELCINDITGEKVKECLDDIGEVMKDAANKNNVHTIEMLLTYYNKRYRKGVFVFNNIMIIAKVFPVSNYEICAIARILQNSMKCGKQFAKEFGLNIV